MSKKETKAERREAARVARIEAQRKREVAKKRKRSFAILVIVIAAAVGGYFLWTRFQQSNVAVDRAASSAGCSKIESHSDQGAEHIAEGTPHDPYNSNPPSSGPHYGNTAEWGIHDETVTPEMLVHNLEHGGIVVHYRPDDLNDDQIDDLETVVESYPDVAGAGSGVILNPNPEIDGTVAMASWQKTQTCRDYPDTVVVKSYIDKNCGKGPEKFPLGC